MFRLTHRLVRALAITLFGFGLIAQIQLSGGGVADLETALRWALLTGALAAAVPFGLRDDPHEIEPEPTCPLAPRLRLVVLLIAACWTLFQLGVLSWGAISTSARQWDGVVAWELRARALADQPTLAQPLFLDEQVLRPSHSYPLLWPLLQGTLTQMFGEATSRMLPVALWLSLGAAVFTGLRKLGVTLALAVTTAALTNPRMLDECVGAVDSGFADVPHAALLTFLALGFARRDALLLSAGTALLIWSKPEGILHALVPIAVAWLSAERRLSIAATLGLSTGLLAWLPLRQDLVGSPLGSGLWKIGLGLLALTAVVALTASLLHEWSFRARAVTALGVSLIGLTLTFVFRQELFGHSAIGAYLEESQRGGRALGRLGRMLWEFPQHALFGKGRLAVTFLAPCVTFVMLTRRGSALIGMAGLYLILGLGTVTMMACLTPEEDFTHYLKSSIGRVLMHWSGAAWIVTGLFATRLIATGSGGEDDHDQALAVQNADTVSTT
ncbi:MAG: hypothetical protein AAF196_19505 [Planctomycetota bacterium]